MANTVTGIVWYLDSGASFHMTRFKEFFSSLEEKNIQMHIEIGMMGGTMLQKLVLLPLRERKPLLLASKVLCFY